MKNENRERLEHIRSELEKIYNGNHYYIDGELVDGEELTEEQMDDIEEATLYDYFEDGVLDVDYIVNSQKEYKACRILIAYGGPNIYINTFSRELELYWWTESEKIELDSDICNMIDEYMEELFNC